MQIVYNWLTNFFFQHLDTMLQVLLPPVLGLIGGTIAWIVRVHRRRRQGIQGPRQDKKMLKEALVQEQRLEQDLRQYSASVPRDQRIAQIHIPGMSRPLDLLSLYVPLRIHPESTVRYDLDPTLRAAEDTHDPNLLFQATQQLLEQRMNGAVDPGEAIRTSKRCVIVGNPGVGKTTLLRYLAIQSANGKLEGLPDIPIYLEINRFDHSVHQDLFDLILAQLGHYGQSPQMREFLQRWMGEGKVLLLLDGLDGTRFGVNHEDAESAYVSMVDAIKRLAARYEQLPIVVTVRKAGYQYRPKLQGFSELEVVSFRPQDSKTFVQKWFDAVDGEQKQEKIKGLNMQLNNFRLQALASNPLLLSLIAIVYEGQLGLPESRVDLYKDCVETLQIRWDASQHIKRPQIFPPRSQLQLLEEIAWHFHCQGKQIFPLDELLSVIDKFLLTVNFVEIHSRQVLEQIARENGLLQEQAHERYSFSHLTFQEYFATQFVITNNCLEDLLGHLHDPWWEEVLLLYASRVRDASPLIQTLLEREAESLRHNSVLHTHLLLAGRCLGEKSLLKRALHDTIVERLFDLLETTPYALVREQAAQILVLIGGQQVNSRLLSQLSSEDGESHPIRESIVQALGTYSDRSLTRDLGEIVAHKETERYIRIVLARALGMQGEAIAIKMLLHVLSDAQEDIYVRQSIALALGTSGDPGIVSTLVQLLEKENENALVLQSLVLALGRLGDHRVVPILLRYLVNTQLDWHVRGSTAKALGMLDKPEVIPGMFALVADNSDNVYVRRRVVTALGEMKRDAIPVRCLLELLADKNLDTKVRCSIANVIATSCNHQAVPHLLQLLTDPDTPLDVNISIVTALGHLGHEEESEVTRVLRALSMQPQLDKNLYGSTLAALGMLGARKVVKDLLALMVDPTLSQDVLLNVVQALGNLGDHRGIDKREIARKLVELLSHKDVDRYKGQNIVRILCALGERRVVPDLLTLLEQGVIERDTRQSIADAIAQLAQEENDLHRLTVLLNNTDIVDDVYRALWAVSRRVRRTTPTTPRTDNPLRLSM